MVILDLFYDLLNLDIPAVCDSYDAALNSICKYLKIFLILSLKKESLFNQ
jgi:hypothetical protein